MIRFFTYPLTCEMVFNPETTTKDTNPARVNMESANESEKTTSLNLFSPAGGFFSFYGESRSWL